MSFLGFGASDDGGDDGGGNGGLWGAIGAAAISGLAGYQNREEQKDTNAANWDVANAMMEFQKTMSNTSYQRGVEDMKKAGLNPMLAYSQGGASTPGGTMPKIENPMQAGISGASQAMATASQMQQMSQSRATTQNIAAQTDKVKSETMAKDLNTAKVSADILNTQESAKNLRASAENTSAAVLGTTSDSMSKNAAYQAARDPNVEKGEKGDGRLSAFEADAAKRKTEARLKQLDVNKARVYSDYYNSKAGSFEPYIGLGSDALSTANQGRRLIMGR